MSSATNSEKLTSSKPYLLRGLYDWIVDNMLTPYILVNSEITGVRVPRQYVKDGQIVLNISPNATSHFEMNNSKLQFRAGFGGTLFDVLLPIKAVQAIYARENGQGMTFSNEIPGGNDEDDDGDGGDALTFSENAAAPEAKSEPPKSKHPHLKVVK
ncbi:MAG: ClpXP protease specificity-enhancing factor [Legionellales bacterium]|nr:ClpXP protease specificity-enhancing factor [Legionellales bacterium]